MRVTGTEWGLALVTLVLAAVASLQDSFEAVVAVVIVIVVVSAALTFVTAVQAARSRSLGRFLLVAATFGFFWLEAFGAARAEIPFQAGPGLPIIGGQFQIGDVQAGIFYIAAFQLMLFVGYSFRPTLGTVFSVAQRRIDQRSAYGNALRYLLAACALLPLMLSFGFDVASVTGALTGGRGVVNPAYSDVGLLNLITFFGLYGASILLVDSLLFRSFSRVQKLLVGTVVTAPFILGGVRHLWLFVAIPVGVVAFRVNSKNITFRRLVKWIAAGIALLIIVQVQLAVRQVGWSKISEVRVADLVRTDTTGQFQALLVAETLVPELHPYFREPAEPYFLIHWIPRRFWPAKPVMESWTFYNDQYTQGDVRYNVTPSIIGQFYLNWGIIGVLYAGMFLGFLMVSADRVLLRIDPTKQTAMAVATGSFIAFVVVSYRFYSPVYFTYFAFAWIGMLLITRRRRSKQTSNASRSPGSIDLDPVLGV